MQTANRIILLVLLSVALLEAVGFLGAKGILLHTDLKTLWCVWMRPVRECINISCCMSPIS